MKKMTFLRYSFVIIVFLFLSLTGLAQQSSVLPTYFDMGNDTSSVWNSFTRVTAQNVFSTQSKSNFGWQSGDGLSEQALAYTKLVSNPRRGKLDPPPIWTNPITEDAIVSDRENTFLFRAAPGSYEIYIVCGISKAPRNQYFDFTVQIGSEKQRVQFEGGGQFRSLKFKAKMGDKNLAIHFSPRSKWVVNAIIAYPITESEKVQKEIITPFEEWTYRMRPDEWAKWKLEPLPPMAEFTAKETDKKRGFVVYTRSYLECIYPQTRPRGEDLNPSLQLFATPGEYEPINFIVLPLKNLSNAKVTVSSIGPVPASNIDVRHVRFMRARPNYITKYRYLVVPDILEHFTSINLTEGENSRFWLTIHVPENARAGIYNSSITFECSGSKVEIPVRLHILPFKLHDDPSKIFGIYYNHPMDQIQGADQVSSEYFRHKADMEHADMVAHGIRNVVMSCGGEAADAKGNFSFKWELLAEKMSLWKKYGFKGPIVMKVNTEPIYKKYMNESYGSHLLNIKKPPEEFSRELTMMVKTIEIERKKRGWPEFLYYPVDEPGKDSVALNFMITVLKACKAAGARTYVTADPTNRLFKAMRPYVDVWCTQPFSPDRETVLADMKANNIEYWCYPNHVNGENDHTPVTGARMTYGFGFWRSGFVALIPWIYSASTGDPFNYLDGYQSDFLNRSEPDGKPIPVTLWEGYREGYDDYRYIYTLEQIISQAKKSPKPMARQKAATAELALQTIWNAIRVQPKYKTDGLWAPAEFDLYRWQIAKQIMDIQKVLKK